MSETTRHRHLTIIAADMPGGGASVLGAGAAEPADGELLLVGDLAKRTGKTVRAIHLYEDLGLLKPHERSKGRYRLFAEDALLRVRWITKLQNLGLSLAEIQELVREQEGSGSAMFAAAKLRDVYREKLEQTRAKLKELTELEGELEASLKFLNTCDTTCEPAVPVNCCSSCERHAEPEHAPDLVAGVHAH
jgi:DNA-binding transcriptional MerR regulator